MTMVDQWCSSPQAHPALLHDEIHVWRASLHAPAADVASLAGTLSADEQARAQQLCFAPDQRRFVVGCGLLRIILGRYQHVDPHAVRFCYGANGKPALDAALNGEPWQFNVSHSHGLVLVAVTRVRQLGVDLERVRPLVNMMEIVQRICSPRERAMLTACSSNEKYAAFFHYWTGKEAYMKATGAGLAQPLHQVEVAAWAGTRRLCIAGRERKRRGGRCKTLILRRATWPHWWWKAKQPTFMAGNGRTGSSCDTCNT